MNDVAFCGRRELPVELAVVIPTLNERANVAALVDRLEGALSGIRWEAVFVDDDSPDGTTDLVRNSDSNKAISAAFNGSGVAACPLPASKVFSRARLRSSR
jgi:glycosyltransferase involved in cell wall biosynthesis